VAAAAAIAGIPALIVMPADAPAIKVANTRGYGAEVVFFDRATERREEIAGRIAAERGAVIVPPYDDPDIIAGQGTLGREIALQAAAQGHALDQVLVPCSGGGWSRAAPGAGGAVTANAGASGGTGRLRRHEAIAGGGTSGRQRARHRLILRRAAVARAGELTFAVAAGCSAKV